MKPVEATVYRLRQQRKQAGFRAGNLWRFRLRGIADWLEQRTPCA